MKNDLPANKLRRTLAVAGLSMFALVSTGVVPARTAAEPPEAGSSRFLARWTLATSDTELSIGVDLDGRLCIAELSSPALWNWTATPSLFPLVSHASVNGVRHPLAWSYHHGAQTTKDGTQVALTFTNADPALEMTSIWQARPGPGPVRHTMFIRNHAARKVTIEEQESLEVRVVGPENDTSVWYINDDGSLPDPTGVFHDKLAPGYQKTLRCSEDQDFIPFTVVDANGGHGIYLGWEWSLGRMALAAHCAPRGAWLKAGNGDAFKTDLEAGETFAVPPAFIGAYQGDLDDAANSLHKYLFNYSMPMVLRTDPSYPKVEWNAFAPTGKGQGSWDSTETKYYPFMDDIAPLGFEEVVLDIGWWPGDATHKPHPPVGDPVDWPSGILAASDYAHKLGIRFGLYWNCNPSMTTLEGMKHRQDDAKYLYDKFYVDFYRSDGTDGNVLQTGKHGAGTRAHSAEDVGYWQTKGYYEVLDSLSATVTNFCYENCSGGGRIKDYGILRRCAKIQNQDRYYPIDARQSFYDAAYALHPMQIAALCGSWSEWQATGSVYEFRSASMGAAYWHPDAPNGKNGGPVWSVSQRALIKDAVHTYKTRLRPLIRTANLYHIFPRPNDKVWDGIEYFDPGSGKGAVYVFRPGSPDDHHEVRFKGLEPKTTYWLWGEDGSISPTQLTGEELMRRGLTVVLPEPFSSDIIFIQDTALGKPEDLQAPGDFALKAARTSSQLFSTSAELNWEASANARCYRVAVAETPECRPAIAHDLTTLPSALFSKLPPGRKLSWKVEALSHGGSRANQGLAGSFTTPETLARGVTFASDMPWIKASAGAGNPIRRDKNLHERPLTMNGKPVEKGLWTHAFNDSTPADIVFAIGDKRFTTFKASVGLEDLGERGSVQFQVFVDGQKKAESPVMRPKQVHDLVVEVTGAKEITLRVLNGGDGYGWDHALWAFARFIEVGGKDPPVEVALASHGAAAATGPVSRPPPGTYHTTWLGNSFPGASNKWVQNFFIHTQVQPDGTVNTWSHWDEGGKKFGVYKDGDVIGNTNVNPNSLETTDKAGHKWKIAFDYVEPKFHEYDFKPKGITCDGAPVKFPDLYEPMALAMANDGQLMIADSQTSPRQQVLFYDITQPPQPRLTRAFGEYGGIASGKPGQVTPTKFWGIRGLGMDAAGNLYVAMSEMGSCLRKFTPEGKLVWELRGDFFVDLACADPTTDGRDVWGIQEHYLMDYSQPPGHESRLVGYSLDRHRFPNDPRGLTYVKQNGEHGLTSPQVVYLHGRRFLFVGGMFASNFINIFRYDDEMAIPSGLILQWGNNLYRTEQKWPPNKPKRASIWRDLNGDGDYQANEFAPNTERVRPGPFWVDKKGNIWMAYGFFRYDFQGLDDQGNPIYQADKITVLDPPKGVTKVARVVYLDDSDTLIVADEGRDMRHLGRVFVCKGYLAGNREAVSFESGAGREAACVAAAGDYVFTGGWKERGRVSVNRLSDGEAVGVFDPGPTVGGLENTGWVDILTGISAFKRADGEYLVFVEEDYKAKVLLYRWKP